MGFYGPREDVCVVWGELADNGFPVRLAGTAANLTDKVV